MKQPPEIKEAKRRIREAYKRGELTEEQVELLKSVGFDPGPVIKPVVCIELGLLFEGGSDAARELGLPKNASAHISACCRGKKNTAYNYHWRYATKEEIAAGVVLENDELFGGEPVRRVKPVVCVELGRLFENARAAGLALGLPDNANNNINLCLRGRTKTAYNYHWRYATEEEIAAGRVLEKDELLGAKPVRKVKPVVCVELGRLFENAAAAARGLGCSNVSIIRCCSGEQGTACNYHWRFATEEEVASGGVLEKDDLFGAGPKRFRKPVVCVELGRLFEGGSDAERELGLPKNASAHISACCSSKGETAYNYHWRFATDAEIAAGKVLEKDELFGARPTIPANAKKPVVCIELGRLFESAGAAALALGLSNNANANISACCRGKKKTAYNYHWRFATPAEIAASKVLPDDLGDA